MVDGAWTLDGLQLAYIQQRLLPDLFCEIGTFSNETGSVSCYSCVPGTYLDVIGMTSQEDCKQCESGLQAPSYGMSECVVCPAGTYNPLTRQSECAKCPEGTYGQKQGAREASECDQCPRWRFTSSPGSTSIDECYYEHQAGAMLRVKLAAALAALTAILVALALTADISE